MSGPAPAGGGHVVLAWAAGTFPVPAGRRSYALPAASIPYARSCVVPTGWAPSAAYLAYSRMDAALESLFHRGMGGSDEADALRDEMDAPWRAMTGAERDHFRGF